MPSGFSFTISSNIASIILLFYTFNPTSTYHAALALLLITFELRSLLLENHAGGRLRHAFIGIGFRERTEAYDFQAALHDHMKYPYQFICKTWLFLFHILFIHIGVEDKGLMLFYFIFFPISKTCFSLIVLKISEQKENC